VYHQVNAYIAETIQGGHDLIPLTN